MTQDDLLRLYPACRKQLVASLSRLVGPTEAEDVADETLVRATKAIGDFREDAALSTWLHRIGMNLAYDLLRKQQRQPCVSVEDSAHDGAGADIPIEADDTEDIERRQMSQCVQELMGRLLPEQRYVLAQADMHDRKVAEIAKDEGITTGNAKIRLHRARRAMKSVLEKHCEVLQEADGVCRCVPRNRIPS